MFSSPISGDIGLRFPIYIGYGCCVLWMRLRILFCGERGVSKGNFIAHAPVPPNGGAHREYALYLVITAGATGRGIRKSFPQNVLVFHSFCQVIHRKWRNGSQKGGIMTIAP